MMAWHYQELSAVADAIRRREISPVALTRMMLDRIAALDPQLHAFVTVTADLALAQAEDAEAALARGEYLGPLHGVPIAVKDNIWTSGVVTTNGMAIRANHRPDVDSKTVERLRAAGAILLGKLKQTEGAFIEHHPSVTIPVNPWDAGAWAGVSSSGSGVATAAGLCFAALGTDTGGSIRMPCDMNGLTGIKPTYARVTRHGVFANGETLDHVGVLARSAVDVAAMLEVIAGSDPRDPTSALRPVPFYSQEIGRGIEGMRIGIDPRFAYENVDQLVVEALKASLPILRDAGAKIVEMDYPGTAAIVQDWMLQSAVEMAAAHEAHYPVRKDDYGPALSGFIEFGRNCSALDYAKAQHRRNAFRGRMARLFEHVDLFALPTQTLAGPSIETFAAMAGDPGALERLARFTCPFDMSGSPVVILPMGMTAQGVPMSFQLVGRHFDETLLLRAGYAFQQRTDWHRRHPPL